jgi:hypothetical protein
VILFVDYQNVYRAARAAFCSSDAPAREGQVDPARLGELIARVMASAVSEGADRFLHQSTIRLLP